MDYTKYMKEITDKAKEASRELAVMGENEKNKYLLLMADAIECSKEQIKEANLEDVSVAEKNGRNKAFLDRLRLDDKRIDGMCKMLRDVSALKDPVGEVLDERKLYNDLILKKVRVPIGVIGIIYEARPNVTADCVSLCLKSGNSVILRGGSDALNSNRAIYKAMKRAATDNGLNEGAFILVEDTSREAVYAMLEASYGIDLIMPRGGESLIKEVVEKSKVPVIKHYKGICHIYVDADADLDMAGKICLNAKVQRPGVCNAMETMLVNETIADEFLPVIAKSLKENGVKLKGCSKTIGILGKEDADAAGDDDYATEWLDLILNIKIVSDLQEAVEHIARFGSSHSDAIVTENLSKQEEFTKKVDSAAVYVNASTRFTDGGEFGKGAEIGISTDKLHARGPMGLEELCSYKYVVHGTGQIRE